MMTVVGLLCGTFHDGSAQLMASASVKDRGQAGRLGHLRPPLKHNSIASYYRDLHRPAEQSCEDADLPQRVRDAEAVFTGTVRDMVWGSGQSCPWVGLTHGLGRDFSVFGGLGWIHCIAKALKFERIMFMRLCSCISCIFGTVS